MAALYNTRWWYIRRYAVSAALALACASRRVRVTDAPIHTQAAHVHEREREREREIPGGKRVHTANGARRWCPARARGTGIPLEEARACNPSARAGRNGRDENGRERETEGDGTRPCSTLFSGLLSDEHFAD